MGGFASPQSGFGAARLSGGLGGLGGKTSPSSFGSGLGGVFSGNATQQTQGFGGTSTFGAGGVFGAPQQQQVTYLYLIVLDLHLYYVYSLYFSLDLSIGLNQFAVVVFTIKLL